MRAPHEAKPHGAGHWSDWSEVARSNAVEESRMNSCSVTSTSGLRLDSLAIRSWTFRNAHVWKSRPDRPSAEKEERLRVARPRRMHQSHAMHLGSNSLSTRLK